MLTPEERKELLEDARDPNRRRAFAAVRQKAARFEKRFRRKYPLDDQLKFIAELQKIFPPPPPSRKVVRTRLNKL